MPRLIYAPRVGRCARTVPHSANRGDSHALAECADASCGILVRNARWRILEPVACLRDAPTGLHVDLRLAPLVCRMLDQRDEAARHEATGAHRRPTASHFAHLDRPAAGRDLDP